MDTALVIIFALFGTVLGSFLNVCIDRLPADRSMTCPHKLYHFLS